MGKLLGVWSLQSTNDTKIGQIALYFAQSVFQLIAYKIVWTIDHIWLITQSETSRRHKIFYAVRVHLSVNILAGKNICGITAATSERS